MEQSIQNQFQHMWYAPAFSSLLVNRRESTMVAGFAAMHLGLSLTGYSGWRCPILAATGIPCPGCGLTTAILQLIHGDVLGSLQTHAFAPIFALAILIIFAVVILPPKPRDWLATSFQRFETRNGITSWVLLCMMLYYGIRLMGFLPFPNFVYNR